MRGVLIGILIMAFLLPVSACAEIYYVDATDGDNSNDGISPDSAWRTISKVNGESFLPGDFVLFKRGETWYERLVIPSSGSADNPITFGAYGSGNKPIITRMSSVPGWDNSNSWTEESTNLWYISLSFNPRRILLSGTEYNEAESKGGVNSNERWWFDSENSRLYVYATSNPSSFYSNIERAMSDWNPAIQVYQRNYIKLENLDAQASYSSIKVRGCNHTIIDNCTSGKYSIHGIVIDGTYVGQPNYYGEIKNCYIDFATNNKNLSYSGFTSNTFQSDGIKLTGNTKYYKVHDNFLKDCTHTLIQLSAVLDDAECSENEVYRNEMTAPNTNWCRGIGIVTGRTENGVKVPGGKAEYNKIYQNYIHHTTVKNQIKGSNNEFYYNIIHTTLPALGGTGAPVLGEGIGLFNDYGRDVVGNKIYNNFIYNTYSDGISLRSGSGYGNVENNIIRNNLIVNYATDVGNDVCIVISTSDKVLGNTFENNNCYKTVDTTPVFYRHSGPVSMSFFNNKNGENGDTISNNTYNDPLFEDAANGDFNLKSNSPCIDAGINVGLAQDYAGNPIVGNPDIGAYEYSPQTCSGTCKPNACNSYDDCSPASGECSSGYCCSGTCTNTEPVAHYHFDEGLGETTADSSGNGNDGTIHGAEWTTGLSGSALLFDGNGYVEADDSESLDISQTVTITAWINPSSISPWNRIAAKSHTSDTSPYTMYGLLFDNANHIRLEIATAGTQNKANGLTTIPTNEWTFVAGTYDGSSLKVYVNGNLDNSTPHSGSIDTNNMPLSIGRSGFDSDYFNGTIDEVRIYDRALTPEEISEHYNELSEHIRADINDDGLVDVEDLSAIALDFGKTSGFDPDADTDNSGEIDIFDVVFVASRFS